ncbi:YhgE/Pip domain-containing protein [Bifidobacterium pseudolongum]|uniref:YhgE/Pip domain-containing protein n=1 Tax=Bifidobacterium pseudolongum TaxID=1694 RepID=UPI001F0F377E|nr:YhgE/Pip domain-containing protein [Bifidobacterium pseudolongum]MCH4852550.1 YhgE/Pip domain-containing protein [Bifidobacterium pseudolongum]
MRNIWFILKRDLKRLLRVPTAWVIIFGLTFIPALYAWFNIAGFWDPYGNTSGIRVAVANEDKGADSSLLGKMNLGDQIVGTLKKNHQLGWQFMAKAEAMECVESAHCYAAIVIPGDFSEAMANVLTSTSTLPQIDYYVNEKANAVAPKITGVGATTVDRQVNSTFVSTASSVISGIVNTTNTSISKQADSSVQQALAQIDKTKDNLGKTRTMIADLRTTLSNTKTKTDAAEKALDEVTAAANTAGTGLATASGLLTKTQSGLNSFTADASDQLDKGSNLFLQASGQATTDATRITNGILTANGAAGTALNSMTSVNNDVAQLIEDLKNLPDNPFNEDIKQIVDDLTRENQKAAATLAALTQLNDSTKTAATSAQSTIDQFSQTSTTALNAISGARNTLSSSALPQLNAGLSALAGTSGTLSGGLSGESALVDQSKIVLTQLADICTDAADSLKSTDALLDTFIGKLNTVGTDLGALANVNVLDELTGDGGSLNAERIANFMLSPTVLKTHTLYPVHTYGSAMAPLFTSLALWVGAFMLMVLIKLEVDDEGLAGRHVTMNQTYMARWLLLAMIAGLQGLVCSIGDLVIGVQTVNAPLFVFTAWFTSLVYVSIAYALSATFMHVGKALVVAMVMLQIPGASGLYPIEMMPHFYRALYPLFPFTYSIDAFRETIGGFYDGHWGKVMLMLLLFAAISFAIGLGLRPLMSNFNHLFAREIEESDMIVGEQVYTPVHRFNLSLAIRVLADQAGYRKEVEERAHRFAHLYPKLMRGALAAGFVVPIALFVTFSFTDGTKLVALATWIVWILLIITFLMVVESIRDSLRQQAELGTLSEQSLRELILHQGLLSGGRRRKRRFGAQMAAAAVENAFAANQLDDDEDEDDEDDSPDAEHLADLENTLDMNLDQLRHRLFDGRKHHEGKHAS